MMLEMLLSSSALIAAVFLVRAVLGSRIGARLRYGLWLLVLLRLLLPVSFGESMVSPANLIRQSRVEAPAFAAASPEHAVVMDPDAGAIYDAAVDTHPDNDAFLTGDAAPSAPRELLPVLWKVGMAATAAWFGLCNLLFWRALRRSRVYLETVGRTRVYAAEAPSPCLFGVFRPAIYTTITEGEPLRLILLHERTHLCHGDHVWALLRTACLVVWWFNPLVWLAAAASRRDCELACDESVLRRLDADKRAEYGRTLLRLAGGLRPVTAFCAAATLSSGKNQLKRRIRAIARWAKPRKWAVVLALLLALTAAGCAFTGAVEGDTEGVGSEEADTAARNSDDVPDAADGDVEDESESAPSTVEPDFAALFETVANDPGSTEAKEARQTLLDNHMATVLYSFRYLVEHPGCLDGLPWNDQSVPAHMLRISRSLLEGADMPLATETMGEWWGEYMDMARRDFPPQTPFPEEEPYPGHRFPWYLAQMIYDREARGGPSPEDAASAEDPVDAQVSEAGIVQMLYEDPDIPDDLVLLDAVAFGEDGNSVLGAALYTVPGDDLSFHVGFAIGDSDPEVNLGNVPYVHPLGIGETEGGAKLEYQPGTLRYMGDCRIVAVVREPDSGQLLDYYLSICVHHGNGTHFEAESRPHGT